MRSQQTRLANYYIVLYYSRSGNNESVLLAYLRTSLFRPYFFAPISIIRKRASIRQSKRRISNNGRFGHFKTVLFDFFPLTIPARIVFCRRGIRSDRLLRGSISTRNETKGTNSAQRTKRYRGNRYNRNTTEL